MPAGVGGTPAHPWVTLMALGAAPSSNWPDFIVGGDDNPATNGEVRLRVVCAKHCMTERAGPTLFCGHTLGLKCRPKPGAAYKNAVASTR